MSRATSFLKTILKETPEPLFGLLCDVNLQSRGFWRVRRLGPDNMLYAIVHFEDEVAMHSAFPRLLGLSLRKHFRGRQYNVIEQEFEDDIFRIEITINNKENSDSDIIVYWIVSSMIEYNEVRLEIDTNRYTILGIILDAFEGRSATGIKIYEEMDSSDLSACFFYTAYPSRVRRALGWSMTDNRILEKPSNLSTAIDRLASSVIGVVERNAPIQQRF